MGSAVDVLEATIGGGVTGGVSEALSLDKESTPSMSTTTNTGNVLDIGSSTFNPEEESLRKGISKKRLGTRGLQIPLNTDVSTTNVTNTEAGGIQI